jgi:delta-aminolevulinic acid dehydratase/porphobilinogen synthase
MRRMRRDDFSRRLARETRLSADDFIYRSSCTATAEPRR